MLQEHAPTLDDYLMHDPKGRLIPGYLTKLSEYLDQEQAMILTGGRVAQQQHRTY